ncbi:glycosyltransferase involved in cell wall biosynthesis [Hypnocyclicus thermotrophus]|uniref:Glycosyltransferase involved in cell wall biosynthesis n=1 Tax=Hypnocyclicus thermotrophus TaxID=1627895 RepID=A0AA46I4U2_9FUSO|nr:glycosyltransferase family 4 protein [Hypnocyclicus thermotrophus]TDT67876.1 glycosyltransferase involved in cell wall biosynthesis [Hypnocyclicus thermotrophus]
MNILIITPYKNYFGGVEIVNKELENIFTQEGHCVDYLTTDKKLKLNILQKVLFRIIGLPYITSLKFKKLSKKYDIIICNGEFSFGIKHPKCINVFHGSYKGYREYLSKELNWREKLSLMKLSYIQKLGSNGKIVIAVSDFIAKILKKQGIKVFKVIENGVDVNKFKPLNIEKVNEYIFVGGYRNNGYSKGFDVLEKIAQSDYKINCVTTRDPKGLLGYIGGNIENDLLPEIYNKHKMLIFPSRFEACSIVTVEAMACGLPIVISKVGIGEKLKNEIEEFVVETWNSEDYIKKIEKINKNYKYYSKLARDYAVKNYSKIKFKKNWLNLLEEINENKLED